MCTFASVNKQKSNSVEKKHQKAELVFPQKPKEYKPSAKVMAMTCGPFPKGFEVDKELELMWEERAQ